MSFYGLTSKEISERFWNTMKNGTNGQKEAMMSYAAELEYASNEKVVPSPFSDEGKKLIEFFNYKKDELASSDIEPKKETADQPVSEDPPKPEVKTDDSPVTIEPKKEAAEPPAVEDPPKHEAKVDDSPVTIEGKGGNKPNSVAAKVIPDIAPEEDSQQYRSDKPKDPPKPKPVKAEEDPNVSFTPGEIPLTEVRTDPNHKVVPNFSSLVEKETATFFGTEVKPEEHSSEEKKEEEAVKNTLIDDFSSILKENTDLQFSWNAIGNIDNPDMWQIQVYNRCLPTSTMIYVDVNGCVYNNITKFWVVDTSRPDAGVPLDYKEAYPVYDKKGNFNKNLITSLIYNREVGKDKGCYKGNQITLNKFIDVSTINKKHEHSFCMKAIWKAFNDGKFKKFENDSNPRSRFGLIDFKDSTHFTLSNGFNLAYSVPANLCDRETIIFNGDEVRIE